MESGHTITITLRDWKTDHCHACVSGITASSDIYEKVLSTTILMPDGTKGVTQMQFKREAIMKDIQHLGGKFCDYLRDIEGWREVDKPKEDETTQWR